MPGPDQTIQLKRKRPQSSRLILTRRQFNTSLASLLLASGLTGTLTATGKARGVIRKAPQWDITEWINGDLGNVKKLKGKVIIIDFFQLWCPGCNHFSGPLMKHWQKKYKTAIRDGELVMLKIHTVFEGHNYQTVKRLKRYIIEKGITIPVGVDRHVSGRHVPVTMNRYQTSGTPEMVIIDKEGMIQFQKFGFFEPHRVEPLIAQLLSVETL